MTRGLRGRALLGLLALSIGPLLVVVAAPAAAFSAPVVLFSSGRDAGGTSAVDLYALDASGVSRLTTTSAEPDDPPSGWSDPELSPSGEVLLATSFYGTAHDVVALDATDPTTVLWYAECGPGTRPTWSADGGRIAYVTEDGGIVTSDAAGGDCVEVVTPGVEVPTAAAVSWSPDGAAIAYTSDEDPSVLALAAADGSSLTFLGPFEDGVSDPAWSPDGDTVAVSVGAGNARSTGLVDLGTQELTALADLPGADTAPAWTADGDAVVVGAAGPGGGLVAVPRAVGGPTQQLTQSPLDSFADVAGSPLPKPEPEWAPTTLTASADPPAARYGERLDAAARLLAFGQVPVSERPVTFTLGQGSAQALTDETGTAATGLLVDVPPGEQVLEATFAGGTGYLPSSGTADVTVERGTCTLENLTEPEQLGDAGEVALAAWFSNGGGSTVGADGRQLTFTVTGSDGSVVVPAVTGGGYASASTTVASGTYTVDVAFAGDTLFEPCSGDRVSTTVTDTAVSLSPDRASTTVGGTRTVTAAVTRAGGTAAGLPVDLTVVDGPNTGRVQTSTTNADGVATFSVTSDRLGTDVLVAGTEDSEGTPVASARATASWLHPPAGSAGLVTSSLADEPGAERLASALAGSGVAVSAVTVTGADAALGTFSGGDGIVGFDGGVVLSTGDIATTAGPNSSDGAGGSNDSPGDAALSTLAGTATHDAAVLEFDFVPSSNRVAFRYVFASEEYDEFVYEGFNDVFAFWVNGQNCAQVPGTTQPVAVDTVNGGNADLPDPPAHPEFFLDNEPASADDDQLDTEMDGLTTVLACRAAVAAGEVNTMRLAIADASDSILDSAVFLQAESLVSLVPLTTDVTADAATVRPGAGTGYTVSVSNPNDTAQVLRTLSLTLPAGFAYTAGTTTGATTSDPQVQGSTLTWTLDAAVAAAGSVSVHLGVTAATTTGTYLASASGTAEGLSVTGFGPGAPVEVVDVVRTLSLAPADASGPVGSSTDVEATVHDDGARVPGVPVTVTVTDGPHSGTELTGTTNADGVATLSYTGTAAGTDTLSGSAPSPSGGAAVTSAAVTRTWTAVPGVVRQVALAPTGTSSRVGTDHTVTATVTDDGAPVGGVDVVLTVTSGPAAGATATVTTGEDGTASWTRTSTTVGTDAVVAEVTGVAEGTLVQSPSATHTWLAGPVLLLSPDATISQIGTTHTVVAAAADAGAPLLTDVTFTVTSGPNAGLTRVVSTAQDGTAALQLTSDAVGVDTVVASFLDPLTERPVTAGPVTHTWSEQPPPAVWTVTLAPTGTTSTVGGQHTVTATVRADGEVVPGAYVTFEITGGPHAGTTGDGLSAADGTVPLTWTGTAPGTDTVIAYVNSADCYTFEAPCPDVDVAAVPVTHTWVAPPPVVTAVTLTPTGTSSPVGTDHTVTARVTHDGVAAAGVPVTFTVAGAGLTGAGTTGPDGRASFTWSSDVARTDSVVASAPEAQGDGTAVSAPVTHRWTAAPPPSRPTPTSTPTIAPTPTPTPTTSPTTAPPATTTVEDSPDPAPTSAAPSPVPTGSPTPSELPFSEPDPEPPAQDLTLSEPSSVPGGSVVVRGEGCAPRSAVDLEVDGTPAGTLLAEADGTFEGPIEVPDVPIGRHEVRATCGELVQTTPLDVVLSTSTGGLAGGTAATAGAILCFFVLVAGQLLRGTGAPAAAAVRRRDDDLDDDLGDDLFG